MHQQLGAHEAMEVHEVLTDTIDGINQFQLYQPHCQDQELKNILQNQIQFMINEYNTMVNTVSHKTGGSPATYPAPKNFSPTYGLQGSPSGETPNASMNQMNDKDVASGMLGCTKSSATMRMFAALECADPDLRNMMVQGAKNCADQAYEVWSYMNKMGYYQVPTMPLNTTQQVVGHYKPMNNGMQQSNMMNMPGNNY